MEKQNDCTTLFFLKQKILQIIERELIYIPQVIDQIGLVRKKISNDQEINLNVWFQLQEYHLISPPLSSDSELLEIAINRFGFDSQKTETSLKTLWTTGSG